LKLGISRNHQALSRQISALNKDLHADKGPRSLETKQLKGRVTSHENLRKGWLRMLEEEVAPIVQPGHSPTKEEIMSLQAAIIWFLFFFFFFFGGDEKRGISFCP